MYTAHTSTHTRHTHTAHPHTPLTLYTQPKPMYATLPYVHNLAEGLFITAEGLIIQPPPISMLWIYIYIHPIERRVYINASGYSYNHSICTQPQPTSLLCIYTVYTLSKDASISRLQATPTSIAYVHNHNLRACYVYIYSLLKGAVISRLQATMIKWNIRNNNSKINL